MTDSKLYLTTFLVVLNCQIFILKQIKEEFLYEKSKANTVMYYSSCEPIAKLKFSAWKQKDNTRVNAINLQKYANIT